MSTALGPERFADLLTDSRTSFAQGFREGALAERARVIELCTNARGTKMDLDVIVSLASQILRACDAIPSAGQTTDVDGTWAVTRATDDPMWCTSDPDNKTQLHQLARLERKCAEQDKEIAALRAVLR